MPIFKPFATTNDTEALAAAATTVVTRLGQVQQLRACRVGDDYILNGGMTYRDQVVQIDAKLDELVISEIQPRGARRIVATFSARRVTVTEGEWSSHIHTMALMLNMPQVFAHVC